MTLSPLTRPVETPRVMVYDLEWRPDNMALRIAGLFDGERYQVFRGIPGLMRAMFTRENRGAWFFAHFGGAADLAFLQRWFVEHTEYQVTMRFSGSAAVTVEVTRGHDTWHLVDSFFLMRDSLENIGRSIGLLKGTDGQTKEQKQAMFYAPEPELIAYNEQDCRILWTAITRFAAELVALGGELRPTIASCAMTLFRRRFLKGKIRTRDAFNDECRPAYIASRVEVFRRELLTPANQYDINSSFPASMVEPCPGTAIAIGTRLPAKGDCFMAEVELFTPPGRFIPPMPYRIDGRVFFPTGRWKARLSGPDVRFAEETGTLAGVSRVWTFEERTELAEYVHTVYGLRKEEKDEFRRLVLKYLLNSLYGKFGEAPEKECLIINPPAPMHTVEGATMLRPGVWRLRTESRAAHEHVPLAAHITAKSRARITRYLLEAGDAYYCDTDSLVTHATFPESKDLGALKLEKTVQAGYFAAPKFYMLDDKVKAKGFPKLTKDDFWSVVAGGSTPVERMARVKEMWGRRDLDPKTFTFGKRARLTLDKRRFDAGGNSTPYDVSELPAIIGQCPEQEPFSFLDAAE